MQSPFEVLNGIEPVPPNLAAGMIGYFMSAGFKKTVVAFSARAASQAYASPAPLPHCSIY
ncbi:MAG: hypothetical protein DRR08_15990 [Candidatus Parabeggiatoa sp. nov. 2]|nr:MAG: hypothetical protein B6247_13125 [Beggiatoa sp. 4572_84]RKZ58601.1 MAG: hypothetical protein DRR08_15990 [Gammaproteobacteria bacterium]HEC84178.1 hypothetical protein [Thioploca sp.]